MPRRPTDFAAILATLRRHRVRFVLVGGVAAVIEGAPVATFDIDVVPDREPRNVVVFIPLGSSQSPRDQDV